MPILLSTWQGIIELDPYGDDWFETEVRPTVVISVAHDFDFAAATPDNVMGAIWNSWQSQWAGVVEVNDVPEEQGGANAFSRSISVSKTRLEKPRSLLVLQIWKELVMVFVLSQEVFDHL